MKKYLLTVFIALLVCTVSILPAPAEDKSASDTKATEGKEAAEKADPDKSIIDDPQELFKQVQIFADSVTLISKDYVKPVEAKDLIHGAIKGMMSELDPYSQFLDADSFKDLTEETKGEFAGVGMEIGMRDGILTVITPIDGTPAAKAGIQSEDKIVKIDGEITRDLTLDEAVKKLRGEVGTKVEITVIREEEDKLLDIKITRAIIKLESIKEAKVIEDNIGYIKISEFQERTAADLRKAVKDLKAQGAESLIVDVRNNPGGLLDSSIDVSDLFLKQDTLIVYTEGRDPTKKIEFKAKRKAYYAGMNLVVLVNKGSASAAEIFAGAMRDNKRGIVIGTTTFGKGSVQTVIPLKDESALRLTTAAYYTPSGENIMDKGIEPDISVEKKKLQKSEKEKAKELKEEKKENIFQKVEKKVKKKKDEEEKEEKKPEEYDNQLQTAVNVLKGIKVFEDYNSSTEKDRSVAETAAVDAGSPVQE